MKASPHSGCRCGQRSGRGALSGPGLGEPSGLGDSGLGLEELMIVNPSGEGELNAFLGEDGTLYALERGAGALGGAGGLFLGDDGGVYRAEPVASGTHGAVGAAPADGKEYLLGEDGRLYELET